MTACRTCHQEYFAKALEIATWDTQCPPCRRERQRKWRARRKAEGRPVVSGQSSPAYYRDYSKGPEEKLRNRVRAASRRALASGRLKRQPCEVCGTTDSEIHHDTYDNPLNVKWFCRAHHMEHHMHIRRNKQATGEPSA